MLRGVVVAGLGGYRSEKRATPWVSPWWWLASVGPDLRKEPWVSPWWLASRRGSLCWWFRVVAGLTPWVSLLVVSPRRRFQPSTKAQPPKAQPPRRRFQAQATTTALASQAQSTTTLAFPTFNRSPTRFMLQQKTKRAQREERAQNEEREKNQLEMIFGKKLKNLYLVAPALFF